jgi:hypothetical protein
MNLYLTNLKLPQFCHKSSQMIYFRIDHQNLDINQCSVFRKYLHYIHSCNIDIFELQSTRQTAALTSELCQTRRHNNVRLNSSTSSMIFKRNI